MVANPANGPDPRAAVAGVTTHPRHPMKVLLPAISALVLLSSCVFEAPFEAEAKHPVNPALLGCWEEIPTPEKPTPNQLLVLPFSANEYVASYPLGAQAMSFKAFAVELEGETYVQIQLLGTTTGPVKPTDRKFHLLKVKVDGEMMEIQAIRPEVLGKDRGDSARLKAAFAAHKADPKLFDQPLKFRRTNNTRER